MQPSHAFAIADVCSFLMPIAANAQWKFRGEPNSWGQTAMRQVDSDTWQIIQGFSPDEDEFKLAHLQEGWALSFPEFNWVVEPGHSYLITFHAQSETISVVRR